MMFKKSKLARIDPDFEIKLRKAGLARENRGLISSKDRKMAELTRLLTKTNGFNMALEELEWKPKKSK